MRNFFILAALAVAPFFTSVAAYTQPTGNLQGNPIYTPSLNEIVPAGKPYKITWNPTTPGTVTLVLLRGPSTNVKPLYAIVEKIPNSGSYEWTPATNLEPDVTHYGIQLIVDATGDYQYSTQFGISNPSFVSSSSSSAAVTSSSISSVVYGSSSSSAAVYTTSSASSYAASTSAASSSSTSTSVHSTTSTYATVSTKSVTTTAAAYTTLASSTTTRASTTSANNATVSTALPPKPNAAVSSFGNMKAGFAAVIGACGFIAMML